MNISFLHDINYVAVLVSSICFFLIGGLWFSPMLMSVPWMEELKRHGVSLAMPAKHTLWKNMLITFALNIVASVSMACLVIATRSTTVQSGFCLGLVVALGFAATSLASAFVWENRSLKLFLIDAGYPVLGIIASALILSLWR